MQFNPDQLERLGYKEDPVQLKMQTLINSAFNIIHKNPTTKTDFFRFLAATNLLNSLVKLPENKGKLSYRFKIYLSRVLTEAISNKKTHLFDSIHYDDNCFYVRCYSLHFSFHNVITDKLIIEEFIASGLDSEEQWDGLRLQPHAESVFLLASEIAKLKSDEEKHRKVEEFKKMLYNQNN